jgi:sulfatase maturation enzyme AslB (radical SAM superfamily)
MDSAKPLTISLNPTYLCNFRCEFCYLRPEQLADQKKLDPSRLVAMVEEIRSHGYYIEHVDLYGGEVGLLSPTYLEKLDEILNVYSKPSISVITNLSKINSYFLHDYVDLSVSLDFEAREKHELVLSNMAKISKPIAILMLASPNLLKLDINRMIGILNTYQNVVSVEIKPYSSNQANTLPVTDKEYEEFVKQWLISPIRKNFTFINKNRIKDSLSGLYSAYSDSHVYITPNGKFGVLEFDLEQNEYFFEMDSFNEYLLWARLEKTKVKSNPICSACPYLGRCLTEHYRDVKSIEKSCSGFRDLLDWASQSLT